MNLEFALKHCGGVVRAKMLARCGLTHTEIRARVRIGTLSQPRWGWYAAADADPVVLSAVRAGGVLTCVSALARHGYWTPRAHHTHVRLTDHAAHRTRGVPSNKGFKVCRHVSANQRPDLAVDPALTALAVASGCLTDEELVAVMDSMLHAKKVDVDALRSALTDRSARTRALVDWCDAKAESGTETLVRFRLARRNVKVRTQARIRGVGRVDMLIGDRLVLEVDSREHHTGELAYERDRRRDRLLLELGYLVIRVTYHQVLHEWAEVQQSILAIVRRRDHVRRLNPVPRKGRRKQAA